jgi:hypothetical protein
MLMLEVLFSVLVLHWVTSKDSNGGSVTDKSSSHRSANHTVSKTIGVRDVMDKFRYEHNGIKPTVTTHISAVREPGDFVDDNEEISKMELGMSKTIGDRFPLGNITVQVGQVREVERGSLVCKAHGEPLSRGGSYRSTEDLVERTEIIPKPPQLHFALEHVIGIAEEYSPNTK